MGALLPVFGLLVLTIEWTVLRQLAPRLGGKSVTRRALLGAGAGVATWLLVTLVILVTALAMHFLGLPEDTQVLATATFYLLLFGGILIVPVAAGFGAALLAAERYRVEST
ncbi:MAG TPA: hypothetical protein VII06_18195 [Chloroflexota bacterium]|jgi:hypothetical protein